MSEKKLIDCLPKNIQNEIKATREFRAPFLNRRTSKSTIDKDIEDIINDLKKTSSTSYFRAKTNGERKEKLCYTVSCSENHRDYSKSSGGKTFYNIVLQSFENPLLKSKFPDEKIKIMLYELSFDYYLIMEKSFTPKQKFDKKKMKAEINKVLNQLEKTDRALKNFIITIPTSKSNFNSNEDNYIFNCMEKPIEMFKEKQKHIETEPNNTKRLNTYSLLAFIHVCFIYEAITDEIPTIKTSGLEKQIAPTPFYSFYSKLYDGYKKEIFDNKTPLYNSDTLKKYLNIYESLINTQTIFEIIPSHKHLYQNQEKGFKPHF